MLRHRGQSGFDAKILALALALSPCVLIQKYLHEAGLDLDLGVLASFNITSGG